MGRRSNAHRARRLGVGGLALVLLTAAVTVAVVDPGTSAEAATTTLAPVADTYVNASAPTTRYGTASQLIVDGSPVTQTFVRFDLTGVSGTVQAARLRLHVVNISNGGSPAGGTVATTSNVTWPETTTTWNSRPTINGAALATIGSVTRNTWVEVDVTTAAQPGARVSFAISTTNSDGAYYDSRNAAANRPSLVLTLAPTATTTAPSTTSTSTTTATTTPSATSTLGPIADAYVEADTPSVAYGTAAQIVTDASPLREILVRFDLSSLSGAVQSARLRLHVANVSSGGSPAGGTVSRVDDDTWVESAVTYATRPTAWGPGIGAFGAVAQNTWAEADVTTAVTTGGVLTLGVRSSNTDGAYYDSRETGANAPQLVVTLGTPVPPVTGAVVAAVGDMVCPPGSAVTATTCRQQSVSDLVANDAAVTALLVLGDLQYDNGELANFQAAYEPSYGRVKAKTKPAPGNHEYNTPGAPGYYTYFGAAAGDPAKGYYSFDVGTTWHVVALNSNCSAVACSPGSTQEQWLRADLAATARPCVVAFWHHPRFSSGSHGDDTTVAPFWDALGQYGAELVLSGHDHDYERFASQLPSGAADPNGIRELIVGTGGKSLGSFGAPKQNSAVRISTFGVVKLTLGTSAYSWQFVNEAGTVLDSGAGTCH